MAHSANLFPRSRPAIRHLGGDELNEKMKRILQQQQHGLREHKTEAEWENVIAQQLAAFASFRVAAIFSIKWFHDSLTVPTCGSFVVQAKLR